MSYSIVIPLVETIHISKFRICGISKRSSKAIFVHYTREGKILGRTVCNNFGQPNHYGRKGEVVGLSRHKSRSRVVHYDRSGKAVGYSRRIFWLLWVHRGLISRLDVIYKLW